MRYLFGGFCWFAMCPVTPFSWSLRFKVSRWAVRAESSHEWKQQNTVFHTFASWFLTKRVEHRFLKTCYFCFKFEAPTLLLVSHCLLCETNHGSSRLKEQTFKRSHGSFQPKTFTNTVKHYTFDTKSLTFWELPTRKPTNHYVWWICKTTSYFTMNN